MDMSYASWYVAFLASGVLLGIAEVFLPGGIAGLLGAVSLVVAMVLGFWAFPPPWGLLAALTVIVLGGAAFLLWIHLFPRSSVGKRMALTADGKDQKSLDVPGDEWVGRKGISMTALRPAGMVQFGNKRYDVLAEHGEWIAIGVTVQITAIRDGQLWVREAGEE